MSSEFKRLTGYKFVPDQVLNERAREFLQIARRRRSVREFADTAVAPEVIQSCIQVAATAPSGANQQPWHFVAVGDPEKKREIRLAAEEEEREFYQRRAPEEWLSALAPLGTDEHKPFLETAPWLIAIFAESYQQNAEAKTKNYYVAESVGIATGMLISALNHCGLATLTHTPSPMKFLNRILVRPQNERPYLLLVVGFPTPGCEVPDIQKKSMDEVLTFV